MELFAGFLSELNRERKRVGPGDASPVAFGVDKDNVAQIAALLTIAERIARHSDNLSG